MAQDVEFKEKAGLCGINSYNIGRPLAQMVHYFWTVLRIVEKENDDPAMQLNDPEYKIDIAIPTGAMGNITAAYISKKSGLPIGTICAGVNANDITHRTFSDGNFTKSERMEKTLSDAINIQVPYNMERLLYYVCGCDSDVIKPLMDTMSSTGGVQLPDDLLTKVKTEFISAAVTDEEMCNEIKNMRTITNGYLIDPHTSVGVCAARKVGLFPSVTARPIAVMSTASPCKFEESCTIAAGADAWKDYYETDYPNAAKAIMLLEERPATKFVAVGDTEESKNIWEKKIREIILQNMKR